MLTFLRPMTVLAALLVAAFAWGSTLSSYKAEITATRHGAIDIRAKGTMFFQLEPNDQWEFGIRVKGGPLKSTEISKGTKRGDTYVPLSYKRDTKLLFVKENINWDFDWDQNKITGKVKKKSYSHDVSGIVHDPNSFQIPLRMALLNGESEFTYQFMKYSRPDKLRFEIMGEELLTLESGRVHTLILKQLEPLRSDEKKLIWVAKDHDFVPVKFTTYEKNKERDTVIVRKLWIDEELVRFDR